MQRRRPSFGKSERAALAAVAAALIGGGLVFVANPLTVQGIAEVTAAGSLGTWAIAQLVARESPRLSAVLLAICVGVTFLAWHAQPTAPTIAGPPPLGHVLAVRVAPTGRAPIAVAAAGDQAWVANRLSDSVTEVDDTGVVMGSVHVGHRPVAVAIAGRHAWVADNGASSLTMIDATTRRVVKTLRLSGRPSALGASNGVLWAANVDGALWKIDAGSGAIRKVVRIPVDVTSLTVGGGAVWTSSLSNGVIARIDPRSGATTGRLTLHADVQGLAFAVGRLWAAEPTKNHLVAIDPTRLSIVDSVETGEFPTALAADATGVWVVSANDDSVSHYDWRSQRLGHRIPVGDQPSAVATHDGHVWVSSENDARVDIFAGSTTVTGDRTGALTVVTYLKVGTSPIGLTEAAGSMWVADADRGTVARFDEGTLRRQATIRVPGHPWFLATDGSLVYAGCQDANVLTRIDSRTNRVTGRARIDPTPIGVAIVGRRAFIASAVRNVLDVVDLRRLKLVERIPVAGRPVRVSAVGKVVVVGAASSGDLVFVDPASGAVTARAHLGALTTGAAVARGASTWTVVAESGEVVELSLDRDQVVRRRKVAPALNDIAMEAGQLWVTSTQADAVFRVDPRSLSVTGRVGVGANPQVATAGDGFVWVASTRDGYIERIETVPAGTG